MGVVLVLQIFEERSEEETLKQKRCARRGAWEMAKSFSQAQGKVQSCILLAFGGFDVYQHQPEERECGVDSGASLHMLSEKVFNSAKLESASFQISSDGYDSQRRSANK